MIDIHSGGEDNIFPHHECEIAQSRARPGRALRPLLVPHAVPHRRGREDVARAGTSSPSATCSPRAVRPGGPPLRADQDALPQNATSRCRASGRAAQIDRWSRVEDVARAASRRADGRMKPARSNGPFPAFTQSLCDDVNVAGAIGVLSERRPASRGRPTHREPGTTPTPTRTRGALAGWTTSSACSSSNEGEASMDDVDVQWIEGKIAASAEAKREQGLGGRRQPSATS